MRGRMLVADVMRVTLPYGCWHCQDGTDVLFNRNYRALWARLPEGDVKRADPACWVPWARQEWFYDDGTKPPRAATMRRVLAVLDGWGLTWDRAMARRMIAETPGLRMQPYDGDYRKDGDYALRPHPVAASAC